MATQQLTIPMFPLDILLFPGESKILHIFEEKYKQLISDCLSNQANFGIPYSAKNKIADFGVEVRIVEVLKTYESGDCDILIEGVRIFKLLKFSNVLTPKLYGACLISIDSKNIDAPSMKLQKLANDYLLSSQQNDFKIELDENLTVFGIAKSLNLSDTEKLEFIKLNSALMKETFLLKKIKLLSYILAAENILKSNFVLN